MPDIVPETLLYFDPLARFLHYNMEGVGPFGIRNCLATTTVDALPLGKTRVTCSRRFDLPEGVPPDFAHGFIHGAYEGIINGIDRYVRGQALA